LTFTDAVFHEIVIFNRIAPTRQRICTAAAIFTLEFTRPPETPKHGFLSPLLQGRHYTNTQMIGLKEAILGAGTLQKKLRVFPAAFRFVN